MPRIAIAIFGFVGCSVYEAAVSHAFTLGKLIDGVEFELRGYGSRDAFFSFLSDWKSGQAPGSAAQQHRTSPLVIVNGSYLGGRDDLVAFFRDRLRLDGERATPAASKVEEEDEDGKEESKTADSSAAERIRAAAERDGTVLVYIVGDRSRVGKSTMCLGLLGGLLAAGLEPSSLGYIKPATQCEEQQLVCQWCDMRGIDAIGLGPVVFYKGFTRAFLDGETDNSAALLDKCAEAVLRLAAGKKVVLIDGVGYPAVGSVCGISNGRLAAHLRIPAVVIGKPGVGDAIDSLNMNATFMASFGVRVLGAIFNKLPREGYYAAENTAPYIRKYFAAFKPALKLYGFVPKLDLAAEEADGPMEVAESMVQAFGSAVDVAALLADLRSHWTARHAGSKTAGGAVPPGLPAAAPEKKSKKRRRATREEIEGRARKRGAVGS
eukprot:PLAT10603.1.p1 GENE.PLAT10603.1~~PLAT10603.1.p1  ORF type:complete len:435 (-),score=166.04 PLAT10603.1:222-1526(-)